MNFSLQLNSLQFLDDLTDADVLIHVLDASGTADSEGNAILIDDNDNSFNSTNPINDVAWIQKELIQWVFKNLETKWTSVAKRGRHKVRLSSIVSKLFFFVFLNNRSVG